MADDPIRILLPRAAASRLTRRRFLSLSAGSAAALGLGLTACGTDDAQETTAVSPSSGPAPSAPTGALEGHLNVFTWAEYSAPENVEAFSEDTDVAVTLDVYESNEAAIARLELAEGSSGYDIVVPTNAFIPQMVELGLLAELDKSQIPNFANQDPAFLDQVFDPGNRYSAVKNWGSTGYVYDRSVIDEDLVDWADFFRAAAMDGVSGNVSALDAPGDVTGMVFWREGIDWNTTDPADLDLAERVLMEELVPHVRAFDSYPSTALLEGSYVLSQAWNGDARTAVLEDPERYHWVLGAPKTELWVDNWCVLANAEHPRAAHAFINLMLDPEVSAREIAHHGYNTAVLGTDDFLPADLGAREVIYFTEEEVARLVPGEVNEAQDRVTEILNNLKAAAGA